MSRLKSSVLGANEPAHIISCNEKKTDLFTIIFGSVFIAVGFLCTVLVMPDVLSGKNFWGLSALLFSFTGVGMNWRVYKNKQAYKYYGAAPLHLNPHVPGLGGQLGGTFTVNVPSNKKAPELSAKLTCYHTRTDSEGRKSVSIRWQGEAPVYQKLTASGYDYSFIFDVPETAESSHKSRIHWEVSVKDNAVNTQTFDRSWTVFVEDDSSDEGTNIVIPAAFLHKAEQKSQAQADQSALEQIPVTHVDGFIDFTSRAGRHMKSVVSGIAFGAVFSGVGLFAALDGWLPGYLFVAIGLTVVVASVFLMGRSIDMRISREYEMIYTRRKIFGYVFSENSAELHDPSQFSVEVTSSSESGDVRTQWCAILFETDEKKIKIAEGIEGKKAAEALINKIIEQCFDEAEKVAA